MDQDNFDSNEVSHLREVWLHRHGNYWWLVSRLTIVVAGVNSFPWLQERIFFRAPDLTIFGLQIALLFPIAGMVIGLAGGWLLLAEHYRLRNAGLVLDQAIPARLQVGTLPRLFRFPIAWVVAVVLTAAFLMLSFANLRAIDAGLDRATPQSVEEPSSTVPAPPRSP